MEYTIQAAARISGLSAHTLRAWERRHNAVSPDRDDAGRRVYIQNQIDRLILLSRLCQLGYSIGQLADKPCSELENMLENLGVDPSVKRGVQGLPKAELETIKGSLLLALRFFKLDVLDHEFGKLAEHATASEIGELVLPDFMREVTALRMTDELTASQSNAITALTQAKLEPVVSRSQLQLDSDAPLYLIVAPQGENFALSNLGIDLICTNHKIRTLNIRALSDLKSLEMIISSVNPMGVVIDFSRDQMNGKSVETISVLKSIIQNNKKERDYHFISPGFDIQNTSGASVYIYSSVHELDKFLSTLKNRQ